MRALLRAGWASFGILQFASALTMLFLAVRVFAWMQPAANSDQAPG